MAGTYYSENKILDIYFGSSGSTVAPPQTWYVGLSTTTPTEAGGNITEPSGGAGYARRAIPNNKTTFSTAVSGSLTNSGSAIQFPESTGSWGTVTHIVFFDASVAGNAWFWEALSTPRTVAASTTVFIAAGGLTVSQNNA